MHSTALSGGDDWGWCIKGGDESGGDGAMRRFRGVCDTLVKEDEDG